MIRRIFLKRTLAASTLAGGCAGRTVVRTGEGNLGALIVPLAFGLAAAATYYGVLEPLRTWLFGVTVTVLPAGDASLAKVLGLPVLVVPVVVLIAVAVVIGLLGRETRSQGMILAGAAVGLLIVAGWWLTGYLAQDGFNLHAPASLTFAAPLAKTTVYVTTGDSSGQVFALTLLGGTLLGAMLSALLSRSFRWVVPDSGHLAHLLIGGSFMGIGAIMAGGCNIGQGLSGMSTTSVKALLAVMAIIAGMRIGITWLQRTEKVLSPAPNTMRERQPMRS